MIFMNIQIYVGKKNFDAQKAERFFKERRIPATIVDLKKHAPGKRELELFARAAGSMKALVDETAKGERALYVQHLNIEDMIAEELMEHPELIKGPIVRNGQKAMIGFDEKTALGWITEGK